MSSRPIALVRRPSPLLEQGLVTHIERTPVDVELALKQWSNYVEALRLCKWSIIEVPAIDECPDGVFIEDTVVIYKGVAIITRPGNDLRKPEVIAIEPVVTEAGCTVERIVAPGTMDGGDVLKVGDTIYVGLGGRTNALGATVITVPISKVLHLKSAVTALPNGTIIGFEALVDDLSIFPDFLAMPEESGAHVIVVGEKRLIMASDAPESAEMLRDMGYLVIEANISEFIKLEGCVTCLSVRIR
jgi:dimethylargininase